MCVISFRLRARHILACVNGACTVLLYRAYRAHALDVHGFFLWAAKLRWSVRPCVFVRAGALSLCIAHVRELSVGYVHVC